jgi:tetratricopeptide (TPR) repeat protein
MFLLNRLLAKLEPVPTRGLRRAVWIVLAVLATVVVLFGGYYYWDRYVHLGDKSPLELDVERMEEAVRQDPQSPEARVILAEFYVNQGMYKQALAQTDQVLGVYPEDEGALLISGIAYVRLGQPESAVDRLEKFVALRRDRPIAKIDTILETAYYFLGESYVKLSRPDEAIPVLEAALDISHTDADALYQLGLAYQAIGQPKDALEQYRKAVRLVPDFAEVYTSMIESYSALGQSDYVAYARGMQAFCLQDYGTAQTHLTFAVEALPEFVPAFLGLGLAYERVGELEAALSAVERALELDPGDLAARQARGRILAAMDAQG